MQTIKKFQIGRKYYPSSSKKIVLMLIKEREGRDLTVVKITPSTEETFTISACFTADEKGAYEYFVFDGLRFSATHILPEARNVSEDEDKAITEAIKRDIEYRKAHGFDCADIITYIKNKNHMTKEQLTQEWIDSLSDCKYEIVNRLDSKHDFLVLGDAMPFIEEVAPAFEYNIVYVKLQTLDDLRGTPVSKHSDKTGLDYFEYEVEWQKAIDNSEQKSLLLFNIDEADNRLVNALKSVVERHGEEYFVGLICTDKSRDLKRTTTFDLVKPVILWD